MDRRALLTSGATAAALAATGGVARAAEPRPTPVPSDAALARSLGFRSAHADVNGTRLHYVIGGQGSPLVLMGGWPQTWWQFRKVMPALARRHRVVVVDIRGMGGSAKPATGYDKKTMARDVRELIAVLGLGRVDVAGHDIGAMVGHSLAANHPEAVRRLALLDVAHPDESMYDLTLVPRPDQPFFLWWFAFNQVPLLPEALLAGRFRLLVDHLCGLMLKDQGAIADRDRSIYADAYSSPDAVRAANGWYRAFAQDVLDRRAHPRLALPVLGLVNEDNPDQLAVPLRRHVVDPAIRVVRGSGHYLAEERPDAVAGELLAFFGA
ncbi:alpha/beta fold hydrolase [Saccharothrix syringae]|uniref:Alpha/beta hydrolase n=1 Tax=Saccharothrix syringae TaxID=103733 RepID=A0A5Q0GRJ9_SACSY|nr:alpha/beta hydrolase [Saccharothrix syringae]QFZ16599.1 alpha/beta hydrolase [Saccharothrix syringae]